jgi:hypothetical protein
VTSYLFTEGKMDEVHLKNIVDAVSKERLVIA